MVVARMSTWKFKPGQRDAALEVISKKGDEAGKIKGFRGHLYLVPSDDPDAGVFIALWEDEESLQASFEGIFREISGDIEQYAASPPEVKKLHVHSAEIAEIVPELAKPV